MLIDPTGFGRIDAINFTLRIPYPTDSWQAWLEDDRLYGMKLCRYFNFIGRGFTAYDDATRLFIVDALLNSSNGRGPPTNLPAQHQENAEASPRIAASFACLDA